MRRPPSRAVRLGQHRLEPREAFLPLVGTETHLDAPDRVQDRPVGVAHIDLGDLAGQHAAAPQQGPDEADRVAGLAVRHGLHAEQLLFGEPADHRRRRRHRLRRAAEHVAALVDPVQPSRVHEREGTALFHDDRDVVRQLADDLRALDLRQRLHAPRDRARIEEEDAAAGRDLRRRQHPLGREVPGAPDVDRPHGEARGLHEPGAGGDEARDDREHQQHDEQAPHQAAEALRLRVHVPRDAARASHLLPADEGRALAEIREPARAGARGEQSTHRSPGSPPPG